MAYLDLLDSILRGGGQGLGASFREAQATWIEGRELPGGGFAGRRGDRADLYYTDFALRALDLIAPESSVFANTARHLQWHARPPGDITETLSLLSCARALQRQGGRVRADRRAVERALAAQALPGGGFGPPGQSTISAYQTFLGVICAQMMSHEEPSRSVATQIAALQRPSGGFAESSADASAQTNATAAAAAVLLMDNGLHQADLPGAGRFLVENQAADGGLRAHPEAPASDLLSSFTGLLTLMLIGEPRELDLPALARFVRGAASPDGGFGAMPGDIGADVEYTFYGIAT
ncbi:MAG TPA: hypothetical protein DEP45_07625, partial [Armatimonadetes bacterium]|nr:hypothetical protein [Armatimonadota bacterium]